MRMRDFKVHPNYKENPYAYSGYDIALGLFEIDDVRAIGNNEFEKTLNLDNIPVPRSYDANNLDNLQAILSGYPLEIHYGEHMYD